jgi:hypothetical protein
MPLTYRTGRHNGHTIYLQTGDEPADLDLFVGSCVTPDHADVLVEWANVGLEHRDCTGPVVTP